MKLVYLLIGCLILVASSSLTLFNVKGFYDTKPAQMLSHEVERKVEYISLPVLKENALFPILSARATLVVDLNSNNTLYEKNPDVPFLPASTTKIVTALVAMDKYPIDWILTVDSPNVEGQKMHLVAGERITVRNLLYGLLVASANDAAEVFASNYPGGRARFIAAMNQKAFELGMINTNFNNPSGLDGDGHRTTARDLVKASKAAMQRPFFKKVVATEEILVKSVDGQISHRLVNINQLVGEVEGVLGVKTGWTEEARENLVTYVERDGKRIMIVVLASQDRFGESVELIDWIFENYQWEMVPAHSAP